MTIAYQDGAMVQKSALSIAPNDFGFSRGLTVFELVRLYDGVPFHMEEHLNRFEDSIKAMGLSLPIARAELGIVTHQIADWNGFANSTIKYYLTAGEPRYSPRNLGGDHGFISHLMLIEDQFEPASAEAPHGLEAYRRGQRLKCVAIERAAPYVKSTNYIQAYLAAREAGDDYDDILFTHHEGYVTEASRGNFFCVIDGVLCTPDSGMLAGVTRDVILRLAQKNKIPVSLRNLTPSDLTKASEAFTCGTVAEMVPVCKIDATSFASTMKAPIFSILRQALTEEITQNCRKSFDADSQQAVGAA